MVFAAPASSQTTLNPSLPNVPAETADASLGTSGPARLRPAPSGTQVVDERTKSTHPTDIAQTREALPPTQGEFELYVQKQMPPQTLVRRLGFELLAVDGHPLDPSPLVPADYLVGPGDELLLSIWGSVDADLRLVVDRSGRISVPRVGAVQVAGVRFADLPDLVNKRIAQVFKNFQSSLSLGQLRGIRILVTGFVAKPGVHAVSSLSTVVSALAIAGGPTASGSYRNIELRRRGELLGRLDLYQLLLGGDRSADRIVQAGDVIHVPPVGTQVGFVGSVNRPAVLELQAGENVRDALRMVGGYSAVADRTRLAVERLSERFSGRITQLKMPDDGTSALSDGDVLRAFSAVSAALPMGAQSKRVLVEGEVVRPAEYVLPQGSSIRDAIAAAGGLTSAAYLYATELTRESVRSTQQDNYDRALRDLETDLARASGLQRVATADEATAQSASTTATSRLIERLRSLKPNGRIVLQLAPETAELPDLPLEDGDRLRIPARPTTVGVFGSVFNGASYLYAANRTIDEYLRLAGGPTRGADEASVFVVRANGNVISGRQSASWFSRNGAIGSLAALPGDTVFVPEETNKTTALQATKDWTQILFQFGLGIAGIKSATK